MTCYLLKNQNFLRSKAKKFEIVVCERNLAPKVIRGSWLAPISLSFLGKFLVNLLSTYSLL
jgi:hypothetical protein